MLASFWLQASGFLRGGSAINSNGLHDFASHTFADDDAFVDDNDAFVDYSDAFVYDIDAFIDDTYVILSMILLLMLLTIIHESHKFNQTPWLNRFHIGIWTKQKLSQNVALSSRIVTMQKLRKYRWWIFQSK